MLINLGSVRLLFQIANVSLAEQRRVISRSIIFNGVPKKGSLPPCPQEDREFFKDNVQIVGSLTGLFQGQ